jgi:flagellin
MSLRINHNISSINGQRQLMKNDAMMAKSLERLSSGLRINRAADDAAGLVISEQMRAQISGLNQAIDNSETAISMVQTTEGALDEVNSLLTKARELVLHAANEGANDVNQLTADQTELDNVIQSITRISDVTQFGTKKLLDGNLNGATSLASSISHVKVGNLANNPGITSGLVSINVTAATKEAITLKGGSSTDSYIFNAAVTGVSLGSAQAVSGVSVALTVGSNTIAHVVTTGGQDATSLASSLDALASQYGFDVAATSGGELKVTRQNYGATDFDSSVTFSRATTAAVTGTVESITSRLEVTSPSSNSGAATTLFQNVALVSGIQGASTLAKSGTRFTYNIDTATGGNFTATISGTVGQTMTSVLAAIQTSIQSGGSAMGFSGATLALAGSTGAGQVNFSLSRSSDTVTTDFNFTLAIDYDNSANTQSEVESLEITTATFNTGTSPTFVTSTGGTVAGSAITGATLLASGGAISLTVNGQTVTVSASGGGTSMTGLAGNLQTAVQLLAGGLSGSQVRFLTGGVALTGQTNYAGATGIVTTGIGFVVWNADGQSFDVSLSVDQLQGNDVSLSSTQTTTGAQAGATLDLTTTTQVRAGSVATVAAVTGTTASSTTGASTIQSGTDATATMTSANGVVLNLTQGTINTDGTFSMTLTTGSADLGYKDFRAEFSSGLLASGGQTNFTLSQGAVFQVGANALQQVSFTIDDISSSELGRGSSTALSSLEDMLSTKQGALLNGMSTDALAVIDASIDEVTNLRGRLGAFQSNALESGLNSLRVSNENLTAAESTIRDVDFASESANFTRNQILVQASTSMLAQANQLPQNVLKLLG